MATGLRWDQRPLGLVLGRWVNAEAATDFTAAGVFGLLNSFDAFEATRAEVCSLGGFLLAMMDTSQFRVQGRSRRPADAGRLLGVDQVNSSI